MADKISKQARSRNMSHIKGKDTSLEVMVRKYLYHHGFRYRKNVKDLPGKPDIVITKLRIAIFVNGCFWHQHENCKLAVMPKSNIDYWKSKLERNALNDERSHKKLLQNDYRVIDIWECELKSCFDFRMKQLIDEIGDLGEPYEK